MLSYGCKGYISRIEAEILSNRRMTGNETLIHLFAYNIVFDHVTETILIEKKVTNKDNYNLLIRVILAPGHKRLFDTHLKLLWLV